MARTFATGLIKVLPESVDWLAFYADFVWVDAFSDFEGSDNYYYIIYGFAGS